MPRQPGGKLDPLEMEEERAADALQHAPIVEPDETMLIAPPSIANLDLVDQGEPATIQRDRLGAAIELLRRYWGRRFDDRSRLLVQHADRIAVMNELQIFTRGFPWGSLDP